MKDDKPEQWKMCIKRINNLYPEHPVVTWMVTNGLFEFYCTETEAQWLVEVLNDRDG